MTPKIRFPDGRVPEVQPADPTGGVASALEDAVNKLAAAAQDLAAAYNSCIEAIRAGAGVLAAAVLAIAQRMLAELRRIIEAVLQAVRYVMEHYGPVAALTIGSFGWVRNVAGPMSGIQSDMAVNSQPNFELWEGDAAEYYWKRITEQEAAAGHLAENAQFIGDWLQKILQENVAYVEGLVLMVVDLAAALVKAAVEAGTIIGIPLAIDTLKKEIDAIIKAVGAHIVAAGDRFMAALGNAHDIASRIAENQNLPGGSWPHAVTN